MDKTGAAVDEEKPRSIRFPTSIWDAIDAEAKACRRSAVKQMEQILALYYGLDAAEVDASLLETIHKAIRPHGVANVGERNKDVGTNNKGGK